MSGTLPLLRTRFELDKAVRQRSFFARALQGQISEEEYLDLVAQLAALAESVEGENELSQLFRADAAALGRPIARLKASSAARLLAHAARGGARELGAAGPDIGMAVLGTSWTGEAGDQLERSFPTATRLLSRLRQRGDESLIRLEETLSVEPPCDPRAIYVFAELVRGAFLGLATHLDATWPAPAGSFVLNGGS